jgi:hypothetical protein
MDRTLLVLLAEARKTGEPGDVAALVDRIKEAPAEEVVETFLAFRQSAHLVTGLADTLRKAMAAMGPVFGGVGRALASMGPALAALQQLAEQQTPPQDPPRRPGRRRRTGKEQSP